MTKLQLQREIFQLPLEEQLELAEGIWEHLEDAPDQPGLPEWQQRILEERIADDDANPDAGSPWHEVKKRILSSL